MSESRLRNWFHQAEMEDGKRPGTTRVESEELRALRRRNCLLEQENEVLRKAAGYVCQATCGGASPQDDLPAGADRFGCPAGLSGA